MPSGMDVIVRMAERSVQLRVRSARLQAKDQGLHRMPLVRNLLFARTTMNQSHLRTWAGARARLVGIALSCIAALQFALASPSSSIAQDSQSDSVCAETSAEVVVAWSAIAYETAKAFDEFRSFVGVRAFALMHLAQHDALNAVRGRYEPYLHRSRAPGAHPIAAAAQAAHDVLASIYPDQRSTLDAALQEWLARIPDGPRKSRGVAVGAASASALLSARADDGMDRQGDYAPRPGPGNYQYTPPWDEFEFVLQPGFAEAVPVVLQSPSHFRSAPPPGLTSEAYAAAFDEVKAYGSATSTVRSADQTAYAHWWAEASETSFNRLARKLTSERELDLWTAARLFALLNVALLDGFVGAWDAKYHYDTWRPYTAIREAESDGNPATQADSAWQSLLDATPFPEYPSAHSIACAGAAEVFAHVLGTDAVSFTLDSLTALPGAAERSFGSFREAARECGESRIMIGFHFRFAVEAGLSMGRQTASYIVSNVLRPRHRSTDCEGEP
jgi:hypothetical protein